MCTASDLPSRYLVALCTPCHAERKPNTFEERKNDGKGRSNEKREKLHVTCTVTTLMSALGQARPSCGHHHSAARYLGGRYHSQTSVSITNVNQCQPMSITGRHGSGRSYSSPPPSPRALHPLYHSSCYRTVQYLLLNSGGTPSLPRTQPATDRLLAIGSESSHSADDQTPSSRGLSRSTVRASPTPRPAPGAALLLSRSRRSNPQGPPCLDALHLVQPRPVVPSSSPSTSPASPLCLAPAFSRAQAETLACRSMRADTVAATVTVTATATVTICQGARGVWP